MKNLIVAWSTGISVVFLAFPLSADTFGSGTNQFTIDFVNVGSPGNGNDAGAGGGIYASPYGGVGYHYRIAVYEISAAMITKATALGLTHVTAGAGTGNQPAARMSWYEAAAFVNWLNTGKGYNAAYNLSWSGSAWTMAMWGTSDQASTGVDSGTNPFRHKNALYFLPSEDEWYKAAFHKNDGVTANYWDYTTGGNVAPDGIDYAGDPNYQAVFYDGYSQGQPNVITSVGSSPSAYGTYGQGGNVLDMIESDWYGVNGPSSQFRVWRGGDWHFTVVSLRCDWRIECAPTVESDNGGFRVASVAVPRMSITKVSSTRVSISWEPSLPGSVLQENAHLLPTGWRNSLSGTNNPALVPFSESTMFFRVVKP